jgi:hypothetical protein
MRRLFGHKEAALAIMLAYGLTALQTGSLAAWVGLGALMLAYVVTA